MDGSYRGWSMEPDGTLSIDSIETVLRKFNPEPILGAVLVVEGYRGPGIEVHPTTNRHEWPYLKLIVGAEGIEVLERNAGRKVVVIPAADFDSEVQIGSITVSAGTASDLLRNAPVYRIQAPRPTLFPDGIPWDSIYG